MVFGGAGLAVLLAAVTAVLLIGRKAPRPAERMQPGRWAIATGVNGQGLGTPVTSCIDAAAARAANGSQDEIAEAAQAEGAAQSCQVSEVLVAGPVVTIEMVCQGQPARSTMSYRGTSYEGTFVTGIGRPGSRTVAMRGQRIGDC